MIALLSAVAFAGTVFQAAHEALLRVDLDGPTMVVAFDTAPEPAGHRLTIDCVAGCPSPVHFVEDVGEAPLGLLRPFDAEPVVVALSAGGSAYHVRAYRLASDGISRILDTATRSAPGVGVDATGAIFVATTERREGAGPAERLRDVIWTWRGGRFVRTEAAVPARRR